MSLITGQITRHGALLPVLVGVSQNRADKLTQAGFPVPQPLPFRAQLDTGSEVTVFAATMFPRLGLQPFGRIPIRTPSTRRDEPCLCDWYDVGVTLVSGSTTLFLPSVHAIASDDFDESEEVQALIGRDILDLCAFCYYGPHQEFTLAF
jgi:hypothetical protein